MLKKNHNVIDIVENIHGVEWIKREFFGQGFGCLMLYPSEEISVRFILFWSDL